MQLCLILLTAVRILSLLSCSAVFYVSELETKPMFHFELSQFMKLENTRIFSPIYYNYKNMYKHVMRDINLVCIYIFVTSYKIMLLIIKP